MSLELADRACSIDVRILDSLLFLRDFFLDLLLSIILRFFTVRAGLAGAALLLGNLVYRLLVFFPSEDFSSIVTFELSLLAVILNREDLCLLLMAPLVRPCLFNAMYHLTVLFVLWGCCTL